MGRKKMTPETPTSESTTTPTGESQKYNKSARIRELFDSGITEVKQISAHLIADGQEVSNAMIYTVLNQYKKSKAGGKTGDKRRSPRPKPQVAAAGGAQGTGRGGSGGSVVENGRISLADLHALGGIVKSFGGVDHVIAVLQAMKSF